MRVLFFSTAFPQPHDPHRAPYNLHRCRALAATHEVAVVSPWRWTERLAAHATRHHALDSPDLTSAFARVEYPTYFYPAGCVYGRHGQFLWWSCRRVTKALVRRFEPDVVCSYWTFPDGEVAQRIARDAGVPAVAMVGGSDVLVQGADGARRSRIQRVLSRADAVITVSDDLRSRIGDLGIEPSNVHALPPAVDRDRFTPGDRALARRRLGLPESRPLLLWVGRMAPVKGVSTLLDACAALARARRDFALALVGGGPLHGRLRAQAAALGLTDRVTFVGELGESSLPDWYRAADVTVCPSLSEGTPNVLLESIACGTPFVASEVGGIPALATPGLDRLVRPGHIDALAAALAETLAEPPRSQPRAFVPGTWADAARVMTHAMETAIARGSRCEPVRGIRLAEMNSVMPVSHLYRTGIE